MTANSDLASALLFMLKNYTIYKLKIHNYKNSILIIFSG